MLEEELQYFDDLQPILYSAKCEETAAKLLLLRRQIEMTKLFFLVTMLGVSGEEEF
jgi:hypothetical protein